MHDVPRNIVFYDGDCLLCSRSVYFLLKQDKSANLKFASIQGRIFQNFVAEHKKMDCQSIVFWDGLCFHVKSTAILKILECTSSSLILRSIIKAFPRKINDFVYDLIAKNRTIFFGKNEKCMLLVKGYEQRFLLD